MASNFFRVKKGINVKAESSPGLTEKGDIGVNTSSGKMEYHNGTTMSPTVTEAHASTLTNKTIDSDSNTLSNIVNANIKAGAAIAYSKLALTNSIVNADIATAAAIAYSKLTLTGAIKNADIAAGTGIDYSKLNLLASIQNGDIASGAGIAVNKLAGVTANRAVASDGSGFLYGETTTSQELARLSGVTGNVQTQIDAKASTASLTAHTGASTGVHGVVGSVVGTSDTQSLSAKTFSDSITLTEIATPSTPASGKMALYPKTDKKLYFRDSTGAERQVGQGSGLTNYVTNADFESDVTGWAAYADAAGTQPVDGTGGSPTVTITRTTSSPLDGVGSGLITKDAANRQGEGVSTSLTIDNADKNKILCIAANYEIASGTFATGDLTAYIVDVTNSVVIQPAGYQVVALSSVSGKIIATFQTTTSTSYRLCWHVATTSASAYTVKIDNVSVGPQILSYGAPITDWQTYTPTGGMSGGGATYTGKWRRVGDSMEVEASVAFSSGSVSGGATFNLPGGYSIDTNKLAPNGLTNVCTLGNGAVLDAGVVVYSMRVAYSSTTAVIAYVFDSSGTYTKDTGVAGGSIPIAFGASDQISVRFIVPITGWSSSVIMSDSADTRVISCKGYKASSGFALTNSFATLVFDTKDFDTNGAFDTSTGIYTVQVPGKYHVTSFLNSDGATALRDMQIQILKNNSTTTATVSSTKGITGSAGRVGPMIASTDDYAAGDTIRIQARAIQGNYTSDFDRSGTGFSIDRISGPTQIAASEKVAARYRQTSAQNVPSSTPAVMSFETKDFDTHGMSSGTGTSWKLTAPVQGVYSVSAMMGTVSTSPGGSSDRYLNLEVYKNGSRYTNLVINSKASSVAVQYWITGTTLVNLNAGDYIELKAAHSINGSNILSTNTGDENWITFHRI